MSLPQDVYATYTHYICLYTVTLFTLYCQYKLQYAACQKNYGIQSSNLLTVLSLIFKKLQSRTHAVKADASEGLTLFFSPWKDLFSSSNKLTSKNCVSVFFPHDKICLVHQNLTWKLTFLTFEQFSGKSTDRLMTHYKEDGIRR